ncbi:MAG: AtpZ/AtpI family protein [Bacteroidota bacterium]
MLSLPDKYRQYIGLGAEIAACLLVPLLLGLWLDDVFETSPWLLLAGIFIGFVLFFSLIFRLSNRLNEDSD